MGRGSVAFDRNRLLCGYLVVRAVHPQTFNPDYEQGNWDGLVARILTENIRIYPHAQ